MKRDITRSHNNIVRLLFHDKGTMDGAVAVYNVMLPSTVPQYKSNDVYQKHGGIVWEVRQVLVKLQ